MNIFLPYEYDIKKSVISLDDRRLIKQILEVYQLARIKIENRSGGYSNHPVYQHYKNYLDFMIEYGLQACREYKHRFNKEHSLYNSFAEMFFNHDTQRFLYYLPFYAEGSKKLPNCIRTTENVGKLYRDKLVNKWKSDKLKPTWTNREIPEFYKEYV